MAEGMVIYGEMLCPGCGYDLRGGVEREGRIRCPECGGEAVRGRWGSRVPWVGRRERGWVRGFVGTVWMACFHGVTLGREVRGRVGKREARGFARVCVWVAVVVGVGMAQGVWWIGEWWNVGRLGLPEVGVGIAYPVSAALDGRVFFIAAAVWLWAGLRGMGWVYRGMLGWMAGRPMMRRRVRRAGFYAMGLAPMVTALWGLGAVCWAIGLKEGVEEPWKTFVEWMPWAGTGLAALGLGIFVGGITGMAWGTGGRRGWRLAVMAGVYPVVFVLAMGVLFVGVMWGAGFMALAVWAMTH